MANKPCTYTMRVGRLRVRMRAVTKPLEPTQDNLIFCRELQENYRRRGLLTNLCSISTFYGDRVMLYVEQPRPKPLPEPVSLTYVAPWTLPDGSPVLTDDGEPVQILHSTALLPGLHQCRLCGCPYHQGADGMTFVYEADRRDYVPRGRSRHGQVCGACLPRWREILEAERLPCDNSWVPLSRSVAGSSGRMRKTVAV